MECCPPLKALYLGHRLAGILKSALPHNSQKDKAQKLSAIISGSYQPKLSIEIDYKVFDLINRLLSAPGVEQKCKFKF